MEFYGHVQDDLSLGRIRLPACLPFSKCQVKALLQVAYMEGCWILVMREYCLFYRHNTLFCRIWHKKCLPRFGQSGSWRSQYDLGIMIGVSYIGGHEIKSTTKVRKIIDICTIFHNDNKTIIFFLIILDDYRRLPNRYTSFF